MQFIGLFVLLAVVLVLGFTALCVVIHGNRMNNTERLREAESIRRALAWQYTVMHAAHHPDCRCL